MGSVPNTLKPGDIKPMTRADAQKKNIYYQVTENTTEDDMIQLLQNYTKKRLYITTRSNIDVILDTYNRYIHFPKTSYTSFDAATGHMTHEFLSTPDVIYMCMRPPKQLKELSNGTASVFLDDFNMKCYAQIAADTKARYGKQKLPESSITGEQCHDRIMEMIHVAHAIMDQHIIPNFFDVIPIKKNGTFQANRKIVIFNNNCNYVGANYVDYPFVMRLVLCIIPHDTWDMDQMYDMIEPVNEHRARLAIVSMEAPKKLFPLLDKNLQVQDIKSKTTYLKDKDIEIGVVYKEKSGSEYLYLGDIDIDCIESNELAEYLNDKPIFPIGESYMYLRMTKKLYELAKQYPDLTDFLIQYIKQHISDGYMHLTVSQRCNPRKFVAESSRPFQTTAYRNANWYKVNQIPAQLTGNILFQENMFSSFHEENRTYLFLLNIYTN